MAENENSSTNSSASFSYKINLSDGLDAETLQRQTGPPHNKHIFSVCK